MTAAVKNHRRIMFLLSKLQLEEETMRHLLFLATGKHTRAPQSEKHPDGLTISDQMRFIRELEKHTAREFKGAPRGPRPAGGKIMRMATPGQKELIREIFLRQMAWDETRIGGFVLRMTRHRTDKLDGLKLYEAANMIEAGKHMQRRNAS